MRLHLLAGAHSVLTPAALYSEQILALLNNEKIQAATAFWISARCGRFYHDFLFEAEDDQRVAIFAQSLRDNFGHRFEPLIILPDLISETTAALPLRDESRGAFEVVLDICRHQSEPHLVLHALVLPESVDADGSWAGSSEIIAPQVRGRLDGLRAALLAAGQDQSSIEVCITEAKRGTEGFAKLFRNAVACQIAKKLEPRLTDGGLEVHMPRLEIAIEQRLALWDTDGILPARSLGAVDLERLADRILGPLLARDSVGTDV